MAKYERPEPLPRDRVVTAPRRVVIRRRPPLLSVTRSTSRGTVSDDIYEFNNASGDIYDFNESSGDIYEFNAEPSA